jgi:hypothetical protein
MPSPTAQGLLTTPGQTVQLNLGQTGVGQPGDVTAILSMTGVFANAVIGVEAVPLGQPVAQPTQPGPFGPVSPVSPSEWIPIAEVGIINGAVVSSPLTLSSAGGLGTGFAFSVGAGQFQLLQLRLISIGSGAVQGGIATLPFPLNAGLSAPGSAINTLELGRIRIGLSILLEGLGVNLQDISQADYQQFQ